MSTRSWRGTILFAGILIVLGLTVGLRLYTGGQLDLLAPSGSESAAHAGPLTTATSSPPATQTSAASPSGAPPVAGNAPGDAPTRLSGDVEQTPFGPVQVEVTFTGSTMTKITELRSPDDESRSEEINSLAAPVLEREALSSQSARIDSVSGATYTSEGYKKSLQSALDKR